VSSPPRVAVKPRAATGYRRSGTKGPPLPVGLGGEKDGSAVLVCKAHYGRLRQLEQRDSVKLERYLRRAFGQPFFESECELPIVVRVLGR
jgi:hypothetical protein